MYDLGVLRLQVRVPLIRITRVITAAEPRRQESERAPLFGIFGRELRSGVLADEGREQGAGLQSSLARAPSSSADSALPAQAPSEGR